MNYLSTATTTVTCVKTYTEINVAKCDTYALRNSKSLRNVIPTHNVIKHCCEM